MKKRRAFTLVEMLVVIAIIGIVAALVVSMNAKAQQMKRKSMVEGDKAKITMAIANYQSKLNFYPPDNGNLANISATSDPIDYDGYSATNPLLYELTGATNNFPGVAEIALMDPVTVSSNVYYNTFVRPAVNNANQDAPPLNYFSAGVRIQEYTNYNSATQLKGLLVPVLNINPAIPNFWHYDSSTPNRHNQSSYDLWAEYPSGSNTNGVPMIITIGNW